ncbi:MAG: methylmalonyl Co-A mutase-associated GTPase MeaB [Acidilobaceae archaeon]|nr:methylmalonyl Co-A mutase-associated GTPase MeaB [Acidilobaceae archaeon]MCX8165915.1 methylmalonyl Co-A mutase-associated GTPase MeaB [Acidilobaceae archaeon]MDW7974558.1 methylmalonyl Co-A mutase-associated GTPase MeaB [Sulfolobales archaeon]
MSDPSVLIERAKAGDKRALGRLLTLLEELNADNAWILERLSSEGGRAHVVGITGMPGAGKSTLISRLVRAFRDMSYKVAVISIDPTSPISSGSIMGDRLRMQEHATDPGVFIRSVTNRGILGGVSLAALAMIEAFDVMGYDKIIVETVGVGQSETDIMNVADTIVVLTMPGAGDDVQALKAGVFEIGDVYVVNKSDRPDAAKTYEYMLFVAEKEALGRGGSWRPAVVKTSAALGLGIRELAETINRHFSYVLESGEKERRLIARRTHLVRLVAARLLLQSLSEVMEGERERVGKVVRDMRGFYDEAMRIVRLTGKRLVE